MRKAYDELMEKIKVTPEMRQRVLERITREELSSPVRPMRLPAWRGYLAAAACLALLLAGGAFLSLLRQPQITPGPQPSNVLAIPNIQEVSSLTELSQLVGFEVQADLTFPFAVEETVYCSYWGELAQVKFSGERQSATYRQSVGEKDNSGDYNAYSDIGGITVNGLTVTLKGHEGTYTLAIWTDGTYSYSLSLSAGITPEVWQTILGSQGAG